MIAKALPNTRQSKYCDRVKNVLKFKCHATNSEILSELNKTFPKLSATTVHRITSRLASRNEIGIAPADKNGAMRYDANLMPHDHFRCSGCDLLRDVDIREKIVPLFESSIGNCQISGRLTISGLCKDCIK